MTLSEIQSLDRQHFLGVFGERLPVCFVRGEGCTLYDQEGRAYTDLFAGIAVNALGHAHPAVVEAVTRQVSTLGHTSNIFAHPQVITLAENLKRILGPGAEEAKVFFSNSGAEANEAAFKIARAKEIRWR